MKILIINILSDFSTHRKLCVVKNIEFIHDYKKNIGILNNMSIDAPNVFKIIPKYIIGCFNKYGNTTVLKFLHVNLIQKELSCDGIDIAVV